MTTTEMDQNKSSSQNKKTVTFIKNASNNATNNAMLTHTEMKISGSRHTSENRSVVASRLRLNKNNQMTSDPELDFVIAKTPKKLLKNKKGNSETVKSILKSRLSKPVKAKKMRKKKVDPLVPKINVVREERMIDVIKETPKAHNIIEKSTVHNMSEILKVNVIKENSNTNIVKENPIVNIVNEQSKLNKTKKERTVKKKKKPKVNGAKEKPKVNESKDKIKINVIPELSQEESKTQTLQFHHHHHHKQAHLEEEGHRGTHNTFSFFGVDMTKDEMSSKMGKLFFY